LEQIMKWVHWTTAWVVIASVGGASLPLLAQNNGGAPSAPPANKSAAPAANGATRAKASLEPLLKQGGEALAGGQIQAARDAFQDAFAIDPRNARAAHGLALCYLYSKDTKKAVAMFDKAVILSAKPDRALVLNAAAAHSADHNNARAAKLIKDYLTANPKEVDEPMVNALGTALMAATPQERRNRLFADAATFYESANKHLEAGRPGFKRWGAEWLAAADADARQRALASQQRQLDALEQAVATAEEQVQPALKELERQKDLIRRGEPPNNYYFRTAEYNYNAAVARHQAALDKLEKATADVDRPKFPEAIALVGIDDVKAPEIGPAAIAAATPSATGSFTVYRPKRPMKTNDKVAVGPGGLKLGAGTGNTGSDTEAPGGAGVVYEPPKPARKVRVTQYAAAFPVAPDLAVTSAAAVDDNAAIQLQAADGQSATATLVRKDDALGLALVRITGRKLTPLMLADTFTGGPVACCSFPTVDLFNPASQKINGTAQPPKEGAEWTVNLGSHPRLAGSPILAGGKVVGVCTAPRDAEKTKLPAVTLAALKQFVGEDAKPAAAPGDPMSNLLQLVSTRETGE
jgi:tetratricopeptide (TPR) repeat protein